MKVKVFTLLWQPDSGGFDDAAVQSFLGGRTVIEVFEHFFLYEKTPVLTLVVTYRDDAKSSPAPCAGGRRDAPPDAAADLDPEERQRFEALRSWRNHYARKAGRPPYTVLTNRQTADVARRQPTSRAQLSEIAGIGESRIEEFGDELLALLRGLPHGVPTPKSSA